MSWRSGTAIAVTTTLVAAAVVTAATVAATLPARLGHASAAEVLGAGRHAADVCHGRDVVTVYSTEAWSPSRAASFVVSCLVKVASGARLTIEPGSVVKLGAAGTNGSGSGIYVAPGGALDVAGTAAWPVVFTSYRDSSVGGDTAPAGSGAPSADYSWAILADGKSSVDVTHAVFRYGDSSIVDGQPKYGGTGFACTEAGDTSLLVTGSLLEAPVTIGSCDTVSGSRYQFSGDVFRMPAGTAPIALDFNEPACYTFGCQATADNALDLYADNFDYDYRGTAQVVAVDVNHGAVDGLALAGPRRDTFSDGRHAVAVAFQVDVVPARTSFSAGPGVELTGQASGLTVDGSALLKAGTVVAGTGIALGPGASLMAEGSAAHPVRFTDSGISTEGDSSLFVTHGVFTADSGPPIIETSGPGCGAGDNGRARVSIENSDLYGGVLLGGCNTAGGDSVTISGDTFRVPMGAVALSVGTGCPSGCLPSGDRLVVRSNHFEPRASMRGPTGYADDGSDPEVSMTGWPVEGVALSGPDENHLMGSGVAAEVSITTGDVPAGASWRVSPSSGAVLTLSRGILGQSGLYVQGRLQLAAGTTVDVAGAGIDLGNSGVLDMSGTARLPVTVVTGPIADDSSGGWAVMAQEGSTVDATHADFRGGWYSFTMNCSGPAPRAGGRFHLTDSSIGDEVSLGDCNGSQNGYPVTMSSNTFDVSVDYDPSALQPAVLLYNVDPSGVTLAGAAENVFHGPAAGHVVLVAGVDIPAGQSWNVSPSSGAVLEPSECLDYHSCSGITVGGGGTLDLAPGTVVKTATPGVGIEVANGGRLNASGTASEPVVFTSINDDQVDGHSNGVASTSKPGANAYGTAVQFDHAHDPSIVHTVFEYASTAVYLKWGAVTIDGSDFAHNGTAVNVEQTTGPDYAYLGNLPCMPPWLSGVYTNGTWFAPNGPPSADISLASLVGLVYPKVLPKIPGVGAWSKFVGLSAKPFLDFTKLAQMLNLEHFGGSHDLVPWTVWSCPVPPDVTVRWPVTPVSVSEVPPAPNYAWVKSGTPVDFK